MHDHVSGERRPGRASAHAQLAFESIDAHCPKLERIDIIDLRENTFVAQIVLHDKRGEFVAVVDACPSDEVALALRAICAGVAESVLKLCAHDEPGPTRSRGTARATPRLRAEGWSSLSVGRTLSGPQAGGVAEWLIAAVLKTAMPQGIRGSNPLASATRLRRARHRETLRETEHDPETR